MCRVRREDRKRSRLTTFGEVLKNLRGKESLRETAQHAGVSVSRSYLRSIEKGRSWNRQNQALLLIRLRTNKTPKTPTPSASKA